MHFCLFHLFHSFLGNDENLKKVAMGFAKEFLLCREQIETQLNILL
jgi:hypothetical protein